MAYKYPNCNAWVGVNGGDVHLHPGQVWDADAAAVKAHPECFNDEPLEVLGGVEQATAAPGEKRNTRRRV